MSGNSFRRGVPVLLATMSTACGWKTDGLARIEQLYPTPSADAGAPSTVDLGIPDCHGLAGAWAVELTQAGTISPLAEPWKITITDLFLATSDAQAFDLTFCDEAVAIVTSTGPSPFGQTQIPQALKSALAETPIAIPVSAGGSFQASNQVWLWGLRNMTNPLTDTLPTDASDARVWDEDGDGNPGVTLTILDPQGDRYMVRRAVWNFSAGQLTLDNAWVTGGLSFTVDESVLGATNNLLLNDPAITPNPATSSYRMRCVGTTFTCTSLAQGYQAVFQDAPR